MVNKQKRKGMKSDPGSAACRNIAAKAVNVTTGRAASNDEGDCTAQSHLTPLLPKVSLRAPL